MDVIFIPLLAFKHVQAHFIQYVTELVGVKMWYKKRR